MVIVHLILNTQSASGSDRVLKIMFILLKFVSICVRNIHIVILESISVRVNLSFLETVPCFDNLKQNYKVDQVFSSNKHFENNGNTPIPLAMPVEYTRKDTIQSYRNYYKSKKRFVQWTNRPVPSWFTFVNIFR